MDKEKFIEECTGACDWDSLILKRFKEFVPENCIVADIGANHGIFTMNLLDNVKTKEIYAIEPDLENFNILKRTIGNGSNVKLVNAAVSNYNGKVDIWEGNGNHTTLNILGENPSLKEKGWKTKRCTVDCATIDYIFLEKLKIQLDVCKIDVEGAEFMVLEGGEKTIPKMKCLFVECHTNDTYSKIIKLCLENKWKPICLKNLYEIKSVDDLDFCYQLIIFPKE